MAIFIIEYKMKYFLIALIAYAQITMAKTPLDHAQHSYLGTHGMALIFANNKIYASHMPLYSRPHDYQIVYEVSTNNEQLKVLATYDLVTILPTAFDLNVLINQQALKLEVAVFDGHFERGGKQLFKTMLAFIKPIYIKKIVLSNNPESQFDLVKLSSEQGLLVHVIAQKPSFDALTLVPLEDGVYKGSSQCDVAAVKDSAALARTLKRCFNARAAYLEVQDFSAS